MCVDGTEFIYIALQELLFYSNGIILVEYTAKPESPINN